MREGAPDPEPTRRALVRGMAWSVPVVAVAVATPVFAVSGDPTVGDVRVLSDSCLLAQVTSRSTSFTLVADLAHPLPAGTILALDSSEGLVNRLSSSQVQLQMLSAQAGRRTQYQLIAPLEPGQVVGLLVTSESDGLALADNDFEVSVTINPPVGFAVGAAAILSARVLNGSGGYCLPGGTTTVGRPRLTGTCGTYYEDELREVTLALTADESEPLPAESILEWHYSDIDGTIFDVGIRSAPADLVDYDRGSKRFTLRSPLAPGGTLTIDFQVIPEEAQGYIFSYLIGFGRTPGQASLLARPGRPDRVGAPPGLCCTAGADDQSGRSPRTPPRGAVGAEPQRSSASPRRGRRRSARRAPGRRTRS